MKMSPEACEAIWKQIEGHLESVIDQLSPSEREIILLRFYRRLSPSEIGRRLAISENVATRHVQRALVELGHILDGRGVRENSLAIGEALWTYAVQPIPVAAAAKLALAAQTAHVNTLAQLSQSHAECDSIARHSGNAKIDEAPISPMGEGIV